MTDKIQLIDLYLKLSLLFTVLFVLTVSYSTDAYAQTTDSFRLMQYDSVYDRVYVANSGQNQVWVINATAAPDTLQVLAKITVGEDPRDIAISDDGIEIYVTNHFAESVSKITYDPIMDNYNSNYPTMDVGRLPWGIVYAKQAIFVANWGGSVDANGDHLGTLTRYNLTDSPPVRQDIILEGAHDGGPWGVSAHPNQNWFVVTDDGNEQLFLINTRTLEIKTIDLKTVNCYNPWDPVITDDGKIVTPCGDSDGVQPGNPVPSIPLGAFAELVNTDQPTFFPVVKLSCDPSGGFTSSCIANISKLEFDDEGSTHNEPWAVYSQGNKIYGVDMYNKANPGEEQEEGTLLIWDATTLDLVSNGKIEYEDHPDKVGVGPRDVLVTPDGKIFVSNSGTHEISNKQSELNGIPFDYSSAVGGSIIACDNNNCITSHPLSPIDYTWLFIIAGIVIVIIIIFIVIKKQKKK